MAAGFIVKMIRDHELPSSRKTGAPLKREKAAAGYEELPATRRTTKQPCAPYAPKKMRMIASMMIGTCIAEFPFAHEARVGKIRAAG